MSSENLTENNTGKSTTTLIHRPRRLRRSATLRRMVQETTLSLDDLIYPMFVMSGSGQKVEISSMPGCYRYTLDLLLQEIAFLYQLGIGAVALFPVILEAKKGDIILLNKTDLVLPEWVDDLENYIQSVKEGARIIRCQYGQVPLQLILDVGYTNPDAYAGRIEIQDKLDHHEYNPKNYHSDHLVNDGFVSVSFTSNRPFCVKKFQNFLDNLTTDVFRGKGILWFWESQLKHIFQLCGKRCSLDTELWTTVHSNQIVFIGRNLDAAQILQGLSQCHTDTTHSIMNKNILIRKEKDLGYG